ncbi:MAG: peptidogalycan biosysnthesis protein, partial [Alphaproteobacteria bacterium]
MTTTFTPKILDVKAADWDALSASENPFISHAFLAALEASGSLGAEKGWQPWHLLIHDEKQRLTSACPLYLKGHSMGEYVFDQAWANAYSEAGGQYYPKLLSAIPFTPVSAPKLLGHKEPLAAAIKAEVEAKKLSSAHVLFINAKEKRLFENEG